MYYGVTVHYFSNSAFGVELSLRPKEVMEVSTIRKLSRQAAERETVIGDFRCGLLVTLCVRARQSLPGGP